MEKSPPEPSNRLFFRVKRVVSPGGARSPVVEKKTGIGLIETFCFDLEPGECGGSEPGGRILGDISRSNSGNGDLPQAGFP